jgi:hypothetical protein
MTIEGGEMSSVAKVRIFRFNDVPCVPAVKRISSGNCLTPRAAKAKTGATTGGGFGSTTAAPPNLRSADGKHAATMMMTAGIEGVTTAPVMACPLRREKQFAVRVRGLSLLAVE